jgi:hypothetical protein
VSFSGVTLRYNDDEACFEEATSRTVRFAIGLAGAISHTTDRTVITTGPVFSGQSSAAASVITGLKPPPLLVRMTVELSGIGSLVFAAPKSYSSDADEAVNAFTGTPCEGTLTYSITHDVT